jgi:hypothetical protein
MGAELNTNLTNTNIVLEDHLSDTDCHVNASEIAEIVESDKLIQIGSDDTNRTLWGKIKKAISVLNDHVGKVATDSILGHIKIGTGLQMTDGVASVKIANNLTTNDTTSVLSAAMGANLNTNIAGKSNTNHTHTFIVNPDNKIFGLTKIDTTISDFPRVNLFADNANKCYLNNCVNSVRAHGGGYEVYNVSMKWDSTQNSHCLCVMWSADGINYISKFKPV